MHLDEDSSDSFSSTIKISENFVPWFFEHIAVHILVEFESDRINHRQSAKNDQDGAHGFILKIFSSSALKLSSAQIRNLRWKSQVEKNFIFLRQCWNFCNFWKFLNFWNLKWQFWQNGHNFWHFFHDLSCSCRVPGYDSSLRLDPETVRFLMKAHQI